MKKLRMVLIAAMLAGTSSMAMAQDAPASQRQGGQDRMAALMQGITLSAEQQAKVDSLGKKYQAERATLMQDQSMDRDARRAKGREMMTKQIDEVKALLTDEQKKVLDKNFTDMQARQQGAGRPPQL